MVAGENRHRPIQGRSVKEKAGGPPSKAAVVAASGVAADCDLSGRLALVTGASGGLGLVTARVLAEHGCQVLIAARDEAKTQRAAQQLRDALVGSARAGAVSHGCLELADYASIQRFAGDFLDRHGRLELLVNNAGVMACPLRRTAAGCELQFGVNHLGHFLLTMLLEPALAAAAPARVVNLSSAGHWASPLVFEDPNYERRPYEKWQAYGQSKTANVLFSVALSRRLEARGIYSNAVHPGMIQTDLGRHLEQSDRERLSGLMSTRSLRYKSPEEGAATSLWAATSPLLEGRGGLYLEDCGFSQPFQEKKPEAGGYMPYAVDPEAAQRLWDLSEELVGYSAP